MGSANGSAQMGGSGNGGSGMGQAYPGTSSYGGSFPNQMNNQNTGQGNIPSALGQLGGNNQGNLANMGINTPSAQGNTQMPSMTPGTPLMGSGMAAGSAMGQASPTSQWGQPMSGGGLGGNNLMMMLQNMYNSQQKPQVQVNGQQPGSGTNNGIRMQTF